MPYDDYMRSGRVIVAWLPAIIWMSLIFYLSAQSQPLGRTPSPALSYAVYLGEYAVLAVLLFWAQVSGGSWRGRIRLSLALSFVFCVLFAASDEFHQRFVSGRDASWLDFLADVAGSAASLAVIGRWGHLFLWRQVQYRRKVLPADPRRGRL
jgi:VanZ family protein